MLAPMRSMAAPEKEWTLLFYNAGHADESKMCTSSLVDLERVGSDANTDVVVMNYRSPWMPEQALRINQSHNGARTYHVTKQDEPAAPWYERLLPKDARRFVRFLTSSPGRIGSTEIAPAVKDVNMGQAETLKSFLVDNMKRYPARHYAVIVSGHGAAFAGQSIVHGPEGRIQNEELARVLVEAQKETGRKVDLVNLNTCFGASVESLYALRSAASAAVASSSTVFAGTQPFSTVLEDLQVALRNGESVGARDLALLFVEESRRQPLGGMFTETLTAVDLPAVGRVATSFKSLQDAMVAEKVDPKTIGDALSASVKYDYSSVPRQVDLTDVGSFSRQVATRVDNASVRKAATEVEASLKACVIRRSQPDVLRETVTTRALRFGLHKPDRDLSDAAGLTVYLDRDIDGPGARLAQLQRTDYARDVQPEAFLRHLSRPAVEARESRGGVARTLDEMGRKHRVLDNKIAHATRLPSVLPMAERVTFGAGMLLGFRALSNAGIPAYPMTFGTYFGVRGALGVVGGVRDAVKLVGTSGPATRQALVSAAGKVALGAATATFGMYLLGVLPAVVAWPAAIVAVGTRVGTEVGRLLAVRHEAAAIEQDDEKFRKGSTSEKLS